MRNDEDYLKLVGLVTEARRGDKESMSELVGLMEGDVRTYIYRLTLNHDLAEDLLQETLLTMVETIQNLKRADKFWPWIMKTAWGKVQHHYRSQSRRKRLIDAAFDKNRVLESLKGGGNEGLSALIREEFSDNVFRAMEKLKFQYRNVLVLRCYEQLSYAEIAEQMECSQCRARVLFFRAKHALKRQLAPLGMRKGIVLSALVIFGVITEPAKAASVTSSVTAASLEVGWLGACLGLLGTKAGVIIAAGLGALTFTVIVKAFLWFLLVFFAVLFLLVTSLFVR